MIGGAGPTMKVVRAAIWPGRMRDLIDAIGQDLSVILYMSITIYTIVCSELYSAITQR
jgi:hypothetical protein